MLRKEEFAVFWNKRLHSLIPTIIHIRKLWKREGLIGGFCDKQECATRCLVTTVI